jgi:mono/diheme cytochrome c family protein
VSRRLVPLVAVAALSAGLAGGATAAPAPMTPAVERGAEVAQSRCAVCHAVAMETRSANRTAPLFRVLSRLYSAKDIETRLGEIAEHGHFDMPALALREDEIEDVAAYIQSLDGGEGLPPRGSGARRSRRPKATPAQWITSAAKRSISSYCGLICSSSRSRPASS